MYLCRDCGKPETEHCIFNPQEIPDGCQCNPRDWTVYIPQPCLKYDKIIYTNRCKCEHDRACHKINS